MGLATGVHHLALNTANMKEQIEFFSDVLGAELKALYWMHGTNGHRHCFLRLNHDSYMSFVQGPPSEEAAAKVGTAKALPRAPGGMGHVAFSVPDMGEMLRLRDRIRDRGHFVLGPVDHGFCHSMYFSGPEGLSLEVCCNTDKEIDARAWIDPECVAQHDISAEELARYTAPAAFKDRSGTIAQPVEVEQKYPPMFDGELLERVLKMDEAELSVLMGGSEPPVKASEPA
jgi:catechol 2,3-dioxygenase-like lactoylglutathione lyase family enzyme